MNSELLVNLKVSSQNDREKYLQFLKVVIYLLLLYLGMKLCTSILYYLKDSPERFCDTTPCIIRFSVFFVLFFGPWLYIFTCGLAHQVIQLDIPKLFIYMGSTFCCAICAEVFIDHAFILLFKQPAWQYRIWPKHHGFTSGVGHVMWPLYGFYLYCLHQAIDKNDKFKWAKDHFPKAILIGIDAMVLEILANTFSLALFGTYYFYYLPDDLYHFTTIQIFIPYVICGYIGVKLLDCLERYRNQGVWIGIGFYLTGILMLSHA
ncbi:MAG: hypothetical protein HQK77_02130 [Desulfobacterales bacterium]|nr:hypothetical protein [Desulfobacterales bacterium]